MISTCTCFYGLHDTYSRFVISHYMNVLLILGFNRCCQNKLNSVSVSVSYTPHLHHVIIHLESQVFIRYPKLHTYKK